MTLSEENVAVSGGHGLRGLSTTKPGRGRCRCRRTPSGGRWGAQHQPRVHALLVRTGGPLCPVQTESGSSPRARACCFSYTYFSNYVRLIGSYRSNYIAASWTAIDPWRSIQHESFCLEFKPISRGWIQPLEIYRSDPSILFCLLGIAILKLLV